MALLKFKRSAVSGKAPALGDLELGELAINTFDGKVYMRKDNGTASIIEVGGGSGVLSFNSRTGAVTLSSSDVTTALGYTPANKAGDAFTGGVYSSGQIRAAGWWGDVSASATGLGVEIGESGGRSYVISYSRDVAAYGPMSFEATDFTFTGVSGGFVGVNTSVRAPIFYDSNNTGYYIDPANTSALNIITTSGYIQTYSGGVKWDESGTRSWSMYPSGGAILLNSGDGAGSFNLGASGGVRAPIFYDSNNTGYYVDPASGSYLSSATFDNLITGRSSPSTDVNTANDVGSISIRGSTTTVAAMSFHRTGAYAINMGVGTDNIFRIGGWSALSNCFQMDSSGNITALTSSRAPIFYDSNDTGYYLDAASTSRLNQINYTAMYNAANTDYGIVGNNGFFDTVNSGVDADALELCYVRGSEVRIGTSGGNKGIRAAIFYKGTNTAYYLDPNGRSNLSNITVASGGTESGIRFRGDTLDFVGRYSNYVSLFNANGPEFKLFDSGYAYLNVYGENAASWRAPIFYDSNNTAYYADPTGTSNFAGLTVANRITGSVTGCTFTQDSQDQDNITLRTDSGFYQSSTGTNAEGWPLNDSGWQHMISCTHTNDGNYFAMQLAAGFFSTGLFYRSVNNNGAQAWSRVALYDNGYAAPLYASIYYDADNTGYYINPNSESVLNTLTLFGELNLSAGTTYVDHSGTIVFRNQGNYVNSATLTTGGDFTASGNVTAYSDARIKENIETVVNALNLVSAMRGVTYTRKDNGKAGVGVIAQEIRDVLPEVVMSSDDDETLSVAYGNIVGVLIEAIKELNNKVETLEASIRSK